MALRGKEAKVAALLVDYQATEDMVKEACLSENAKMTKCLPNLKKELDQNYRDIYREFQGYRKEMETKEPTYI